MEKVTIEEKEFKMGHPDGTTSIVKGTITRTDHGTTDKDGNPKISVNIGISPIETPAPAPIHLTKEQVKSSIVEEIKEK